MERLIVLRGIEDCGKSATLNLLIDQLIHMVGTIVISIVFVNSKDRRLICRYNGQIIGVSTDGDNSRILNDNFNFFIINKCSVGITASRPSQSMSRTIQKFTWPNNITLMNEAKWTARSAPLLFQNAINNLQASYLLSLI